MSMSLAIVSVLSTLARTRKFFALAFSVSKALAALVVVLNIHSWPFVWHLRLFRPVYTLLARYWLFRLYIFSRPRSVRSQLTAAWHESLSPIGLNPFDMHESYKTWAGPDDCDFLMHLSNSSYPKTLDCLRFKFGFRYFPTFFRVGGWSPLGETHFSFLREIPVFSRYEGRASIASWDHKWMYVLVRFVTPARKSKSSRKAPADATPEGMPVAGSPHAAAAAAAVLSAPEPDGATLHCVAVTVVCFKIGRLTIPPALVLAAEGMCGSGAEGTAARVRALRADGDMGALRAFLTGGWRAAAEGERWWEDALGGPVEERRAAGMKIVEGLRAGMEGARGM